MSDRGWRPAEQPRASASRFALKDGDDPFGCGYRDSIGATMLLGLAGGEAWMRSGQRLGIAADKRLDRLALLTPATAFFQAPGALRAACRVD